MPVMTYREALRSAMAEEMERDESVVILGEDIGVYGGTHLVTDGLLDRFGPKRVIDTPIAEGGFTGAAIGMAMMGMRPIVEMMTWNFSFQAVDQIIQNAAKLRYFSAGQAGVPLVIRGPNGGGVQLSAQHTHSLEGFYGHFPGLKVVSPVTPHDAKGMMLTAIREPNPVIFLEAGALYGTKGEVPEGEVLVPFGKARIAREGDDVTLVGYGRQVNMLLRVADRLAEDEHLGRGDRPALDPPLRRADARRIGTQDAPGGGGAGAVALVQRRLRGRRHHPGAGVRRSRCPGGARQRRGSAGALRPQSGDRGVPERAAGHRRRAPRPLPVAQSSGDPDAERHHAQDGRSPWKRAQPSSAG